jgi:hypothetical protein
MSENRFEKLDGHRVAKIIYGTIIVLVVIVTLEDHPPEPWGAIASVLGASVAVALAEFYSELIGKRINEKRRLTPVEIREIMGAVSAVFIGALLPLPILILSGLDLFTVEFALMLDKWLLIALLVFYGYAAAALSGSDRLWATLFAILAGSIGGAVVLIKETLSHL